MNVEVVKISLLEIEEWFLAISSFEKKYFLETFFILFKNYTEA